MPLASVISLFALALVAPWVSRACGRWAGWVLAAAPAAWAAWYAGLIGRVHAGEVLTPPAAAWVEPLGVSLSTRVDGLSLLFALLVTGVGALVTLYAAGYLSGSARLGRFYAFLIAFMASMLGLVVSDNLIVTYAFWELTSVASFLLIGFTHERDGARRAALRAMIVTGFGGLALLAGLVLLGTIAGSFEFSDVLARRDAVTAHRLYPAVLALVCLGAFTKSAQVPFHFWLPGAMEAPAPVSAYLHSATMVKAGVFVLARFAPVLGGTDAWAWTLQAAGGATMVYGAFMAARSVPFKRILAYTTVSALGSMVMLLGVGGPGAAAAMGTLLAHAMYKGALFMVAGTVTRATGEKDTEALGGLARAMPATFAAAAAAGASMIGLAPFFGFSAKYLMKGPLAGSVMGAWLVAGVFVMGACTTAAALLVAFKPFVGRVTDAARDPGRTPVSMLLGPLVLGAGGLVGGLAPGLFAGPLIGAAAASVTGEPPPGALPRATALVDVSTLLGAGTLAIVAGVGLYALRGVLRRGTGVMDRLDPFVSGAAVFDRLVGAGLALGRLQTRLLQNGSLGSYVRRTTGAVLLAVAGLGAGRVTGPMLAPVERPPSVQGMVLVVLLVVSAFAATVFRYRLAAVASLGVTGVASALIFVYYGAPDVAMSQFAVETLTVLIFVLVFHHLPQFASFTGPGRKLLDGALAAVFGGAMAGLTLLATGAVMAPRVSSYFAEHAVGQAMGRNVINVIIVDFRAGDTFGELVVLALAGLGVAALLAARLAGRAEPGGVAR